MTNNRITCLSCGVFRLEIESLARQGKLDCDIITLDSMLHMKPAKLEKELDRIMDSGQNSDFLLLYGDCHPHMHEMQERVNATRVTGLNCCEILLGKAAYRKMQQEKVFIFLPEWTQRWQEIFTHELGFEKPEVAKSFMQEHCKRLAYVDTGVIPVPDITLHEISEFFDMPIDVLHISLDNLWQGISSAIQKIMGGD
jgi:hypothetical protein